MNIAIPNASNLLVERLKERAAQNHRSPEEEARVILEQALVTEPSPTKGPAAVLEELRKLGVKTAPNSTEIIRADRDRQSR